VSDIDQIRRVLKQVKFPAWVEGARAESMVDHTGDPAVRVTIVVRAGREGIVEDGAALNELSRRIHVAIDAAGVHLFPYTRFVGAGEVAA
jgi:hypothetical protein